MALAPGTATAARMETFPPPETFYVPRPSVSCEGIGGALGHPRVWLAIGASGYADCGYCDRRFVLEGSPADTRPNRPATVASAAH